MKIKLFLYIIFVIFLSSCNLDKKNEYSGYALISYGTNVDYFKSINLLMLPDYNIKTDLKKYLSQKDTLSGIYATLYVNNPDYVKILTTSKLAKYVDYDNFYLIKINYTIKNIDQYNVTEDVKYINILNREKKIRYINYSTLKRANNILNIKHIEYL